MIKKIIKIQTSHRLHLRIAGEIADIYKEDCSKALANYENDRDKMSNCSSFLDIHLLEASYGKYVQVSVDGKEEMIVFKKIEELLTNEN